MSGAVLILGAASGIARAAARSFAEAGHPIQLAARNVARFSMPMFLHPRPDVVLKPGTTADDFLQQRLREIGLKS